MTGVEEASRFTWISSDRLLRAAGCLTLTAQAKPAALAGCFGERVEELGPMRLADVPVSDPSGPHLVALREVGGWTLAVEINGWQGSRPEVLCRLSESTRAVSMVWSVVGSPRFSYAASGEVVTTFEMAFPDRRFGTDPDALEPSRRGLPWQADKDDDADEIAPQPVMLALAARITGLTPQPAWFEGRFTILSVEPWAEDLQTIIAPEVMPLTYHEPPMAWALQRASSGTLRRAVGRAAELAAAATGLAEHEAVASGLLDPDASTQALARLSSAVLRDARKGTARRMPLGAYQAVEAIRHLANPSVLAAAFLGIEAARTALAAQRQPLDVLRSDLAHLMGDPPPPAGSYGFTDPDDPAPIPDTYHWVTRHWLRYAGSITFASGTDLATVARAFGGNLDTAPTGTPHLTTDPTLALRSQGDWKVAIEATEALRVHQESLQAIDDATAIVSVRWSARNRVWLYYLSDGHLCTVLDPHAPEDASGADPHALDRFLDGLALPAVGAPGSLPQVPTLLALTQRITGVPLLPSMLDLPHRLVPLSGQMVR